jgi:transposase
VPQKYQVTLTAEERATLEKLIGSGSAPARTLTHARILLKADEAAGQPGWSNAAIAAMLEISEPTISRVRQRFCADGLEAALHRKPPARHWERKLDGAQEAHLIALACGEPPEGRAQWSLRLLAEQMVVLGYVEAVSYETIRRTLKRGSSNLG